MLQELILADYNSQQGILARSDNQPGSSLDFKEVFGQQSMVDHQKQGPQSAVEKTQVKPQSNVPEGITAAQADKTSDEQELEDLTLSFSASMIEQFIEQLVAQLENAEVDAVPFDLAQLDMSTRNELSELLSSLESFLDQVQPEGCTPDIKAVIVQLQEQLGSDFEQGPVPGAEQSPLLQLAELQTAIKKLATKTEGLPVAISQEFAAIGEELAANLELVQTTAQVKGKTAERVMRPLDQVTEQRSTDLENTADRDLPADVSWKHVTRSTRLNQSAAVNPEVTAEYKDSAQVLLSKLTQSVGSKRVGQSENVVERLSGMGVTQINSSAREAMMRPVTSNMPLDKMSFQQQIIDQLQDTMTMKFNPPQTELRIRLVPENLGQIAIKLQLLDGAQANGNTSLTASVVVENEGVKDALMANLSQIKGSMQESSGLQIKEFTVTVRPGQEFSEQQQQQQQSPTKKKGFFFAEEEDAEALDSISLVQDTLSGLYDYVA